MTTQILSKTVDKVNEIIDQMEGIPTGDDAGIKFLGQISTGTAGDGKEAVFGEGDSYGPGEHNSLAFHADIATTTGLVVTGATDVTEILGSDSGSTVGLFNGETSGLYILIGSDHTFGGVKAKISTAGDADCGKLMGEYMATSGVWTPANYMVTTADGLVQKACDLGYEVGSEHWRFGFNPLILPVPWEKAIMNINGVDYERYWARFKLTDAIVLDPVLQQLKFHTNHFERNPNGTGEGFGVARPPFTIIKNLADWKTTDADPKDADILYADDITMKPKDNKFEVTKIDSLATSFKCPLGLDTSIPLVLNIDWLPETTNVGSVEWQISWVVNPVNTVLDGSKVSYKQVESFNTSGTALETQRSTFLLPIIYALPGETITVQIKRDDVAGAGTYTGNVNLEGAQINGYSWRV